MPRYFFHVHDGVDIPDHEGTELGDVAEAQIAAVRLSAGLLTDHAAEFWKGEEWKVDVTDETGLILFQLLFVACRSPSMNGALLPWKRVGCG